MRTKVKAKKDSGITLVALIITIIILIILAAVTLKALFNDKLVETAIKAGEDYKIAQGQEMNELGKVNNKVINVTAEIGKGEASKPSGIVGAISFGELTWNNGKASVTVTKNSEDNYKIEYKVTNKDNVVTREYAEVASGETITDLNLGDLVTARLTDGTNHSKPADLNVLDENAPQVTLKLKEGVAAKGKKATVVATVIEEESGVASYKFEYKLSTEDSYKSDSNGTITTSDKTKEYEYTNLTEQEVNNLKVTVIDNAGNTGTAKLDVTPAKEGMSSEELQDPSNIGKIVVGYNPDGTEYSTAQQTNNTGSAVDQSGNGTQIHKRDTTLKWRLWKVDSSNVYLISDKPTSTTLTLTYIAGYNNGVRLLNEICANVYSDSYLKQNGVTVRNMRLSDLLGTDLNDKTVIKASHQFGSDKTGTSYTSGAWPITFTNHDQKGYSVLNKEESGNEYVNAQTEQGSTTNRIQAYNSGPTHFELNEDDFSSSIYYQMVLEVYNDYTGYWLATRNCLIQGRCDLGIQGVGMYADQKSIRQYFMFPDINPFTKGYTSALRPMVCVPIEAVKWEYTSNSEINMIYKN